MKEFNQYMCGLLYKAARVCVCVGGTRKKNKNAYFLPEWKTRVKKKVRGLWRKSRRAFQPVGTDWWLIVHPLFFPPVSCLFSRPVSPLTVLDFAVMLFFYFFFPSEAHHFDSARTLASSFISLWTRRFSYIFLYSRKSPRKIRKKRTKLKRKKKEKHLRLVGRWWFKGKVKISSLLSEQLQWQKEKRDISSPFQLFFAGEMNEQLSLSPKTFVH